jgi:cell division protein FtsI (penicillin-binding protein 3)
MSGTGSRADINGLAIAGKTGTAQKVVNGAYSQTEYMASFVGFFPADNPKLLCVVVIDNPKGLRHTGGGVAAPVVREVFKRIVNQSDDLFFDEPAPLPTPVVNYVYETKPAVANVPQTPDEAYHPNLTTAIYTNQMPDLCGKTLRQAVGILHEIGIDDIEIEGSGVVVSQKPTPHSPVNPHVKCILKLQPTRTPLE